MFDLLLVDSMGVETVKAAEPLATEDQLYSQSCHIWGQNVPWALLGGMWMVNKFSPLF
jgi:hypothetical protein